jgi:hypothetical protein
VACCSEDIDVVGVPKREICSVVAQLREGFVTVPELRRDQTPVLLSRGSEQGAMKKLDLSDVTICAADSVTTALAARALIKSTELCSFGDAILFSDVTAESTAFRTIRIEPLRSRADYSRFVLRDLAPFVHTPYVLIAQWDGYVLEPRAWRAEFLQYDWIGAKWPWHTDGMTVGNGGFSLRSRRLLEMTRSASFNFLPDINEDEQVCRVNRLDLVRVGIRFAPEEIADSFSYERSVPTMPTFGFHGLFNMWCHVDDGEMTELSSQLGPHVVRSMEFMELLLKYFQLRKFKPALSLYSQWKRQCTSAEIRAQALRAIADPRATDALVDFWESLNSTFRAA